MAATETERRVRERMDRECAELTTKKEAADKEAGEFKEMADAAIARLKDEFDAQYQPSDSPRADEDLGALLKDVGRGIRSTLAAQARADALGEKLTVLDDPKERERRVAEAEKLAALREEGKKPSAKDVAKAILENEGRAMHYRDITRAAQEGGLVELSGKTPEATINAMLAVAAKAKDTFVKVAPGVFDLIDRAEKKPAAKKAKAAA
jgi:hypothetical protein